MDISVIIVNYNTKQLTLSCIKSIFDMNWANLEIEIILVDNASSDDSINAVKSVYPSVILIENKENIGFGKANNCAVNIAKGKYVLLINSDTVVHENTICKCFEYIEEHSDIGALGCKIILPDGKLDAACKRSFPTPMSSLYHFAKMDKAFPKSKVFGQYNLTYLDENEINEVDCLEGAFMLMPAKVFNQIGGFDEDYFMYGEDIDLCFKIKNQGYKIIYYPLAEIVHYKRASGLAKKNSKTQFWFYKSMLMFYEKHCVNEHNFIVNAMVKTALGILIFLKRG